MLLVAEPVPAEVAPRRVTHAWAPPSWGVCVGVSAVGALGGALVFLGAHRSLIDDSYITLDYARTLAEHGQWGLQPGHQANTATSPLNVIVLAGLIILTGRPVVSAGILLIITLAVMGAALSVICRRLDRNVGLAAMAITLLVVNPLLISTIGLETYLGIALIAALGAAVLSRRPVATGVVCGLLVLTRADLAAFALAGLIAVIALAPPRTRARDAALVIGVAGIVALPWFVASWWWLGSAVPDTLLFKTSETWGGNSFAVGLWYYGFGYPVAVALALLPAAVGVIVWVGWCVAGVRQQGGRAGVLALVWGLGGVLHVTIYLLLAPPPYHWYYGPAIAAFTMIAVFGMAGLSRPLLWAGSMAGVLLVGVSALFLLTRPWQVMPISSNWASASEYSALAARIPSGTTVQTFGEVGTVAFFADATVVDRFSDRAQVAKLLRAKRATAPPLARALIDFNYYRFTTGPPIRPVYKLTFAEDPKGVAATSWRPYAGQMVVRIAP
jgi:hypothetical protein